MASDILRYQRYYIIEEEISTVEKEEVGRLPGGSRIARVAPKHHRTQNRRTDVELQKVPARRKEKNS